MIPKYITSMFPTSKVRLVIFVGSLAILLSMLYTNLARPSTFIPILLKAMSSTAVQPRPVIVVGSGLAGLSASYEALKRGAPSVHLVDSAAKPGGNSIKASSGINGAGTRFQRASGIERDDLFHSDTVRSAGAHFKSRDPPVDREGLVSKLTNESTAAVEWLTDEIGVDLSVVAALGGHSIARTHRGAGKLPPGAAIVSALLEKLKANDKFTLSSSARVTSVIGGSGEKGILGVQYEVEGGQEKSLEGAVVFATGGFAGDATGLLARYRPDLKGMPSTNDERPGAHNILTAAGAELLDMDSVQIHPTGFVDPSNPSSKLKSLAAEMLRGHGAILLSPDGSRFVNELETRKHVSQAIMDLPPAVNTEDSDLKQWDVTILLDAGATKAAASHIGFYEWKGLLQKVKVSELASNIKAVLHKYASTIVAGGEDEFGRKNYGQWELKPDDVEKDTDEQYVYIGRVTPIVHFTMGGVAIDKKARVLRRKDGELVPIQGLFAAGEITGGIHGDNRLGGSSLLECVVFGRTAGAEAAMAGS